MPRELDMVSNRLPGSLEIDLKSSVACKTIVQAFMHVEYSTRFFSSSTIFSRCGAGGDVAIGIGKDDAQETIGGKSELARFLDKASRFGS